MIPRRIVLTGLGGLAVATAAYFVGAFRAAKVSTDVRLAMRSSVIATSAGALEYGVAGRGPPLMMIHGTGGGFDQGLLFAHGLREAGMQIVAPSRFGYLRNDGFWSGTPSPTAFEQITVPTLILSCEDDLFGTADTARLLVERIPDAELTIYLTGGHIWLGRDPEVAERISDFIRETATGSISGENQ